VFIYIYLTPVQRKLIHKGNPFYLLCCCLITISLGSGTIKSVFETFVKVLHRTVDNCLQHCALKM